ncbi:hypothetical protein [Aureliella helgolandensis]|uniref:hypothetical protein n=1 Tax=Aureliella helgolandensis TaxID=2527968 RepID=UPI0011A6AB6A|nr:hypothetical protein [Aureliella helgolandensis]
MDRQLEYPTSLRIRTNALELLKVGLPIRQAMFGSDHTPINHCVSLVTYDDKQNLQELPPSQAISLATMYGRELCCLKLDDASCPFNSTNIAVV